MRVTVNIMIILALFAVSIWLQFFLSGRKNRWAGLVIPAVCLIISLIFVAAMFGSGGFVTGPAAETEDGRMAVFTAGWGIPIFLVVLFAFLICNIPTAIYLVIYFSRREKIKVNAELDKMNIQDLE